MVPQPLRHVTKPGGVGQLAVGPHTTLAEHALAAMTPFAQLIGAWQSTTHEPPSGQRTSEQLLVPEQDTEQLREVPQSMVPHELSPMHATEQDSGPHLAP